MEHSGRQIDGVKLFLAKTLASRPYAVGLRPRAFPYDQF
jgi:hypothetical protein